MPYYHKGKCSGQITFWSRKCTKCKYKWPVSALWAPTVPVNMTPFRPRTRDGRTIKYTRWAEEINKRVPGASSIAGVLPAWPRWARMVSVLVFILVLAGIIYGIYWGFTR